MKVFFAIPTLVLVLFAFTANAGAGWGHHHRYVVASQPTYYMPVAAASAPAESANSLLTPLVLKLVETVIDQVKTGNPLLPGTQPPGTSPPTRSDVDLSKIEANLAALSERVENTNTTLRTHGEQLVAIKGRLDGVEAKIEKLRSDLDESSPLLKKLATIEAKLNGKPKEDIEKAFFTDKFTSDLKDIVTEPKSQATLDRIKVQLDKALAP